MSEAVLYIVSTPIGTLGDLSPRAQNILSSVDFIACEDTRHTSKLLNNFGIKSQLESLHVHNEKDKTDYLINKILNSTHKSAAVVSDAGTPCISDPGSYFIRAAHKNGIRILSIPGPSSMTSALAASGFIQPRSLFSGFLGRNKKDQIKEFAKWKSISPCIAIFFESPKRIIDTLNNLKNYFIDSPIQVCISREISKKFEEHIIGNINDSLEKIKNKIEVQGEFVVTVNIEEIKNENLIRTPEEAAIEVQEWVKLGKQAKQASKEIAEKYELNSKEIYNTFLKLKQ
ncbi:16S rRNA (cytidine(1402)-2'-O)-methyltransferase [Fluviispira multicolorata]|uniref:Ribosomal RNA small subunit methyltransferase I n=1 Tax=Fluviispira multicolorata TaxID=2654512 RepID=A0A833N6N9_9BACT|nr:16S rRNA (cytidine(1402)-2'-O)-methyltransferase [Fluviispira multicolorata]KAB8030758.1 16S rRNA (cytidine(1402)-2'-O)-methyltransferase [Fluviispira multicolorata]